MKYEEYVKITKQCILYDRVLMMVPSNWDFYAK